MIDVKRFTLFQAPLLILSAAILSSCSPPKPSGEIARSSYFTGLQIGQSLQHQGLAIDEKELTHGLHDGLTGRTPALNSAELQQARENLNLQVNEKTQQTAQQNKIASDSFLEKNKKNPDWKTTSSGIQYKIILEGKGRHPGATSTVIVDYIGTLIDGTKFDSSKDRGHPLEFRVDRVVKGWGEILPLMSEGSHWIVLIPAELAYGSSGSGPIPPNSALFFDMELIKIK